MRQTADRGLLRQGRRDDGRVRFLCHVVEAADAGVHREGRLGRALESRFARPVRATRASDAAREPCGTLVIRHCGGAGQCGEFEAPVRATEAQAQVIELEQAMRHLE